jgi:hypothetical protein
LPRNIRRVKFTNSHDSLCRDDHKDRLPPSLASHKPKNMLYTGTYAIKGISVAYNDRQLARKLVEIRFKDVNRPWKV